MVGDLAHTLWMLNERLDTDLEDAVERIIFGAFYQSGQSCIGVQRILIHDEVYDALRDRLAAATGALRSGDPDWNGWRGCDEWRCHFHVPVDLDAVGGLGTTRAQADAALQVVLAAPERWGTRELHVEIETYTWNVLPETARGAGELVDGLEREMRHVLSVLEGAGWSAVRA